MPNCYLLLSPKLTQTLLLHVINLLLFYALNLLVGIYTELYKLEDLTQTHIHQYITKTIYKKILSKFIYRHTLHKSYATIPI